MITKEAEGALAALTQEILHVFPELTPLCHRVPLSGERGPSGCLLAGKADLYQRREYLLVC